jgi:hypothetical protein
VAGLWLAASPEPAQARQQKAPEVEWDPCFGDRRVEIVFIGLRMDQDATTRLLDTALVTGEAPPRSLTLTFDQDLSSALGPECRL